MLELIAGAGVVRMCMCMCGLDMAMAATWHVLELVWRWADSADVLGGWRTVEASPLVCRESKGVDRLYMGKKVCKVVTFVAIEDGRGRGRVVHCEGGDSRVQVLRVHGTHR